MCKAKTFILFMSFLAILSCTQEEALNVAGLTEVSEDKVEISKIALQLAKEFEPELDINQFEGQLDEMANEIKARTGGKDDPRYRIRVLSSYIKEKGFGYD